MLKEDNISIDSNDIYKLVLATIKFPNSQICKHFVALDLLSLLQSKGVSLDEELVDAISKNSEGDCKAIKILNKIIA